MCTIPVPNSLTHHHKSTHWNKSWSGRQASTMCSVQIPTKLSSDNNISKVTEIIKWENNKIF